MAYTLKHPFSSLIPSVLSTCMNPVFIETGANVGHGVAVALECGFSRVYSIEADPLMYEATRERFAGDFRVSVRLGDSPFELRRIVVDMTDRATIYLDAHASFEHNPLLEELEGLVSAARRDHTVLIDDVRMFGTTDWRGLSQESALEVLRRVNTAYRIRYAKTNHAENDLLIAEAA